MKIYAKSTASEGGRQAVKGSNDILKIELSHGNSFYGYITMNAGNREIVINKKQGNEFIPVYRDTLK
jgi:hypothetical protein